MNRQDVKNYNDLAEFLSEYSRFPKRLYHYTTYDSLLHILNGKSFRLTKTSLLNDKKESEFSNGNNFYVMSMTSEKEYISMWSMYGKPSGIKIRIDFSKSLFKECFNIQNIYTDACKQTHLFAQENISNFNNTCALGYIAYIDKEKNTFKYNSKPFDEIAVNSKALDYMAGFLKYEAWEFEKEIRARISASNALSCNYLYMDISDRLIRDIHVTFNPWLSDELKEAIVDNLGYFAIKCSESDYTGQIDEL